MLSKKFLRNGFDLAQDSMRWKRQTYHLLPVSSAQLVQEARSCHWRPTT